MTTVATRGLRAALGLAFALALGLLAAVSVAYLAGLGFGVGARWGVFAGALALPRVVLAVLTALALAALLFAWAAGVRRRWFLIGGGALVAVLAVALTVHVLVAPPTRVAAELPAATGGDAIRVLAWNVRHGDADASARAALVRETSADIAVFPELTMDRATGEAVPDGYQLLGTPGIGIVVLVADRLGPYRLIAADESGAGTGIVLAPEDADAELPRIVAVHVMRISLSWGSEMWNDGLDWVAAQCAHENTVALGDFNASARNMPSGRLGACTTVDGLAPSWPTSVSSRWGGSIDHIMVTPDWSPAFAATLDVPDAQTDHRPVVAELTRSR
jgi:endonuclease/exonuclease/phosphatase (EEP) superfamily protein YafD